MTAGARVALRIGAGKAYTGRCSAAAQRKQCVTAAAVGNIGYGHCSVLAHTYGAVTVSCGQCGYTAYAAIVDNSRAASVQCKIVAVKVHRRCTYRIGQRIIVVLQGYSAVKIYSTVVGNVEIAVERNSTGYCQ